VTTPVDPIRLNQTTTGDQSPPQMVTLPDGRLFYVWTDNATGDTTATTLQGRIFSADGTPLTSQFAVGGWAVDGSDAFDVDNMSLDLLGNGNVMVSYVRSGAQGDGSEPVFSILNPSVTPGTAGFVVRQDVEIQQTDSVGTTESPPVTTVLADGRVLFVWSKGGLSDDTPSMTVWGRIYAADGTASTNEFQVGSVAVDGSDGYDTDSMTVTQLSGGNVVIGLQRNNQSAGGDEPVYSIINPSVTPGTAGFAVISDAEMQQTDTTTWESPPVITALSDGRWMAVWVKDGLSDTSSMTLQGRIFNANGTASTNEFRIGSTTVDGNDAYDTDNVTITQLANGNVVVGYVDTGLTGSKESPFFNIINPSLAPGATGFAVTGDVQVNALSTSLANEVGPPVIAALPGSGGNFVVAWVDGNAASNVLKYQIYSGNGTALSPEFIAAQSDGTGISNVDSFDWDSLQIVPLDSTRFVINWVGSSDGSGTGAFSTGAITIDGQVASGTVDGTAGADSITGTWADAGGDSVNGADGLNDSIAGAGGNDTLDGGAGRDTLDGGAGDDRLILSGSSDPGNWADLPDRIANDPLQVNTATTGHQSPPKVVELADGRVLYVWTNDAASDGLASMTIQGRIFTAEGLPATDQFTLTSWPVDGSDQYDTDALNVDLLNNGNVLISYVRNGVVSGFAGHEEPVFSIINPTITPNNSGFYVAQNVEFQQTDVTTHEGPPVVTVLSDGRIFAVWGRNGASDDIAGMDVQGRIFNADGTAATNEFTVGSWDVDGHNGYDTPSLTVTELAGGNVVVAYVRSTAEIDNDEPVFSILNPNVAPGTAGFAVASDVEMQGSDTTTYESPPVVTALDDGRFLAVWFKDGASDNLATMTVQGRIFNANGTAASGEFQVGTMPIDGGDSYDTDNLVIENIGNGRVVVGYVESGATNASTEYPVFSLLDTTATPGTPGFTLVSGTTINIPTEPASTWVGPPVIEALDDGTGRFVAVWGDGISSSNAIKFRIFDNSGNPLSGEVAVTTADGAGLSNVDSFDWESLSVTSTGAGKFVISWVGSDDGSGTGVQTSGPVDANDFAIASGDVLIGGESGETLGDMLDASAMTANLRVSFTGNESGTVSESGGGMVTDGVTTVANARMEMFVLDRSAWTDSAALLRDSSSSGAGATGSTLTLNSYSGVKAGLDIGYVDDAAFARLAQGVTLNGTSFASNATVEMDYGFVVQDARGYQYFIGKIDIGGNAGSYDGSVITSGWDPASQSWVGPPAPGTQFTLINASGYPWSGASNVVANSSLSPYSNDVRLGAAIDAPIIEGTGTQTTSSFSQIERITLGGGQDTVDASVTTSGVNVAAGGGNDSVAGGAGNDTLAGDAGNDTLAGGDGADTLTGGDGNDLLTGDGNLLRNGGLEYGVANNTNLQTNVADWGNSSGGGVEVWGSGQGGITAAEGSNFVELDVESGQDTLFQDVQTTAGQSYTLTFSASQRSGTTDSVEVWWNGVRVSTITPGATWASYSVTVTGTGASTRLEFRELAAQNNSLGVLLDNISLIGGGGADSILGEAGNDTLLGGIGNDTLDGGVGNDSLSGEAGDDLFRLSSSTGTETILGGETGETSGDTLDASGLSSGVTLTLATPESGTITASGLTVSFSEVERTVLTSGADTATGSSGADYIDGSGGNDSLRGGLGNDTLLGGDGNDTIRGGDGGDSLLGGAGNDTLVGGGAGDTVDGGDGNDLIYGGSDTTPASYTLWANDGANRLFRIEVIDNVATRTQVGTTAQTMGDIAMDASGRLFGISGSSLYRIDTTTAGTTLVGTVGGGASGIALSFGPDGLLYTSAGASIIRFNADVPGTTTTVWTNPGGGNAAGDFLTVGDRMFVSWVTPGGTTQLLRLSLDASNNVTAAETLGTLPAESYGLALGPNGEIYAASGTNLFQVTIPATPVSGGSGALTLTTVTNGANSIAYWGATSNYEARLGDGVDGADSLTGGAGDDTIFGDVGADTLDGGSGNDSLLGGAGNDSMLGGLGADTLLGDEGNDTLDGGAGNDSLSGGAGNDSLLGNDGDDTVSVDTGSDTVDGGAGNDSLLGGAGNDSVAGGLGADTLLGEDGNDTLDGGAGNDTLSGGTGNDLLYGGDGDDTINDGTGRDTIYGGTGNDFIDDAGGYNSTSDANLVFGEGGNDTIYGSAVGDTLDGGDNEDLIGAEGGNDSVLGGAGNDTLRGEAGADTLVGGAGNDSLDAGSQDDDLILGAGDSASGGDGDDEFTFDRTLAGNATITLTGGEGAEEASLDATNNPSGRIGDVLDLRGLVGVTISYSTTDPTWNGSTSESGTASYLNTAGQTVSIQFSQIESVLMSPDSRIVGTAADDTMGVGYVDAQGDVIDGADGANDAIFGGLGNDYIDGGTGDDTIEGNAGDDYILGGDGAGNDSIDGGAGNDFLSAGAGNDSLSGGDDIDALRGGDGNDLVAGGAGNDDLMGEAGNDTVSGDAGDDYVGGQGGTDSLDGGAGNDSVSGGDGNDTVLGGDGDDLLIGGAGADLIEGGAGNDTITFTNPFTDTEQPAVEGGGDTVRGGTGASDADVLDLRGAGPVTLTTEGDPDDAGAVRGTATFQNGTVLTFSGIESILRDNDDVVAGAETGDVMDVGYTDAQGDRITEGADSIFGNGGNDEIGSGGGDDFVSGGQGDDLVTAGLGNDIVQGGSGDDALLGDAGNDTLSGGTGNDLILAGDNDDRITGDEGDDVIYGEAGNDSILGGDGEDQIEAGDGNDTVTGDAGNDALQGGLGDDLLSGGVGDDWFNADAGNDTILGGDGNDRTTLVNDGDDLIDAGAGNDSMSGGIGNDTILGGQGDDTLRAGAGDDTLSGDAGNDSLSGDAGNDTLQGGDGDDLLIGGAGADLIEGGAGNDTITFTNPFVTDEQPGLEGGGDTVRGGTGASDADVLDLRGAGPVTLTTEGDPDDAGAVRGTATFQNGTVLTFSGIESILRDNDDVVDGTDAGEFIGLGYTDAQGDQVTAGSVSVSGNGGNDNIQLGGGNDTVSAGAGNDFVAGGAGDDALAGDAGNDFLSGAAGNDSLTGGSGADTLSGGIGTDTLAGGDGDDEFSFGGADQATGGAGNDVFFHDSTELSVNATIDGGDGTDTLDLSFEYNGLTVTLGTDPESGTVDGLDDDAAADITFAEIERILTGEGDDTIAGEAATGPVTVETGAGNDSIVTGSGNDNLAGGDGADTINGGAGNDTVDGGAGNDTLTGGAGADVFVADGTADRITDFDTSTGIGGNGSDDNDFIDLTQFYNPTTLAAWNAANPTQSFDTPLDWLRHEATSGVLTQAGGLIIENDGAAIAPRALAGENTGVICYARGTRIATARGPVAVEKLREGDRVKTRDAGWQPIRWIGSTTVSGLGGDAPVVIAPGTFGNRRTLTVSPRHRMLVTGWEVESHLGLDAVFVPARLLIDGRRVRQIPQAQVEYFHILLDQHHVIFAEGAASESFHPGAEGWKTLSDAARIEILDRFPVLKVGFGTYGPTACAVATGTEAALLRALRGTLTPTPALSATVIRLLDRFAASTGETPSQTPAAERSPVAGRAA
jgi:Ca2+-binding RTX toxin-like protein